MFRYFDYKKFVSPILVILWCLLLIGCPTQPTNPPDPATFSVDYTTYTEIWLRVQIPDSTDRAGLRVYRGDSLLVNFPVAPADTVVIDSGLHPNTTYAYRTVRVQDEHEQSPSELLSVTTLPTTSHDFTWTIDTLGSAQYGYGSSYLNDVAIIDDDNIWAVGEINVDSGLYGAAVWDGMHWTLKKLIAGSSNVRPRGIWAFSSRNIWFAAGSIYHWDGEKTSLEWSRNIQSTETVEKVWGASPTNLYFVGNSGTIVHYDGATFTRVASGTELDFTDIWGSKDPPPDPGGC